MSQYQQIRVRVEAVYPKGLASAFPHLHRELAAIDNRLLHESPPLMELVPILVRLSQEPDLSPRLQEVITRHGHAITRLYEQISQALADWKLSPAERLLNDLDEAFIDLEAALAQGPGRG